MLSAPEPKTSQSTNLIKFTLKINRHNPLMYLRRHHLQRFMRLALVIIKFHILYRSEDREDGHGIALRALVWEAVPGAYG